jgi:predicted RNase H-like HicB family nuclease
MTYTATCEWDGYNWVAAVEEVAGAFTQAKRLDLLPARLVEVIKLTTGKTVETDEIVLHPHIDPDLDDTAAEIAALEEETAKLAEALAANRRKVARELKKRGFTLRDIGVIVRVSHQRVHQILGEGDRRH